MSRFTFAIILLSNSLLPLSANETTEILVHLEHNDRLPIEDFQTSKSLLEQNFTRAGYVVIWTGGTYGRSALQKEAAERKIPLIIYADIRQWGQSIKIQAVLIHSFDGSVIERSQSGGSAELGLAGKWFFIFSEFTEALQDFPVIIPEPPPVTTDKTYPEENTMLPAQESDTAEGPGTERQQTSEGSGFRSVSLDLALLELLPLNSYSRLSVFGTGLYAGYRFTLGSLPLEYSLSAAGSYEFSNNRYIDHLYQIILALGISWPFTLGNSGIQIIPGLSGGGVIHLATGDFDNGDNPGSSFFMDQYYTFSIELCYLPYLKEKNSSRIGYSVAPRISLFPNSEKLGIQVGLSFGIRMNLQRRVE